MAVKHPLLLLNLAVFCHHQRYLLPVLYLFYKANGLTVGDLFLFQGIFSLVSFTANIPAGCLADLWSRKKILILSYLFYLIRLVLWLCFKGYWIVLTGEILFALSKAFASGVYDSYIYDYLKENNKKNAMLSKYGKINFFMSAGTALAVLSGAVLYEQYGVRLLLLLEFVLTGIGLCALFFLPRPTVMRKKYDGLKNAVIALANATKTTLSNPSVCPYILASALLIAIGNVTVWSFQPLMKQSAVTVSLFGIVYFFNHLFRALAGITAPRLKVFFSFRTLMTLAAILSFISCFGLMGAFSISSASFSFFWLLFCCVAVGFQLAFSITNVSYLHDNIFSTARATTSSVNGMTEKLFSAGALMVVKLFVDHMSISTAIGLFSCISIVCFVALYAYIRYADLVKGGHHA